MVVEASRVAVGTIQVAATTLANQLIAFIFYLGIARLLTLEDVGVMSLMLSTIAIFNTLTLLALNSAVIKYVSEFLGRGDLASASAASRKAFKAITLISAVAFTAVAFLSPVILGGAFHGGIATSTLLLLLGTGLLLNYTSYYGAVMTGLAMFGTLALQNLIYFTASKFPALALAYMGFGVDSVALGFFLGASICLVFSIVVVRGRMAKGTTSLPLRALFSFSLPVYVLNIISLAQGWMDILALYSLTSALASTGIYFVVVASVGMLSILWSPLASTLFPALSSRYGANGAESVKYALTRALKLTAVTVMLVSSALAAVSPTALSVVYGQSYVVGAVPFAILAILSSFLALSALFVTALQAINRTGYIAVAGALSLLANGAVLLLLVEPLGLLGAALGRAAMAIVAFIANYLALRTSLKVPWNTIPIRKGISAAVIVGGSLFFLDSTLRLVGLPPLVTAALDLALFLPTALVCQKRLKLLDREDLELLGVMLPGRLRVVIKILG